LLALRRLPTFRKLQASMRRRDLTRWRAPCHPRFVKGHRGVQINERTRGSSSMPMEQPFVRPPRCELSRGGAACGLLEPVPMRTDRSSMIIGAVAASRTPLTRLQQWLLHRRRWSEEQRWHVASALTAAHIIHTVAPERWVQSKHLLARALLPRLLLCNRHTHVALIIIFGVDDAAQRQPRVTREHDQ
jgi:uncharacterized membrane protein